MIKEVKKTMYICPDGTEFDNMEDAKDYEYHKGMKPKVVNFLRGCLKGELATCIDEMAEYIIRYRQELVEVLEPKQYLE